MPAARTPTKGWPATAARSAPFGVVGTAAYIGSGRVHDSGVVGSAIDPKRTRLEDLSIGDFGAAVTFGGLTVGGHYQFGRYNVQGGGGPGGLLTKGQPNSNAFAATASYTIGPVIFGARCVRELVSGQPAGGDQRAPRRASPCWFRVACVAASAGTSASRRVLPTRWRRAWRCICPTSGQRRVSAA